MSVAHFVIRCRQVTRIIGKILVLEIDVLIIHVVINTLF